MPAARIVPQKLVARRTIRERAPEQQSVEDDDEYCTGEA